MLAWRERITSVLGRPANRLCARDAIASLCGALADAILPRAPVCRSRWFDTERLARADYLCRENRMAVDDKLRRI
jgi:hypothetical protein